VTVQSAVISGARPDLHSNSLEYVPAIDGLRAVAIIAVILNHYFDQLLPRGYFGVDVFFVISGFVISGSLVRSRSPSAIQFLISFYARRVKRLLPALVFCVLVTSLLFVLLTTRPQRDVFNTGAAALLGLSNIFLYRISADYFSTDATLNPFTHTWSLGVEEQFYLFYPGLLLLFGYAGPRPKATRSCLPLAIVTLLSFAVFLAVANTSPIAAFYLLPGRFWELALGALTFFWVSERGLSLPAPLRNGAVPALLLTALLLLLALPLHEKTGLILIGIVTAALLAYAPSANATSAFLSSDVCVGVGLLSYSLYLWHWPILVLGRWTVGETTSAKVLFLILAVCLAVFSFVFIERPLRFRPWFLPSRLLAILLGVIFAGSSSYAVGHYLPKLSASYNDFLPGLLGVQPVEYWGDECHGRENLKQFQDPFEHCLNGMRTPEKPNFLYLIGDSHAAELLFMLRKSLQTTPYALKFINTASNSDFVTGFTKSRDPVAPTTQYILDHAEPGDLLMMAFHRGDLNDRRDAHIPLGEKVEINAKTENFVYNAKKLVAALRQKGVRVILVKDTPLLSVVSTSPACNLQIKLFGESICRVSLDQDLHTRARQEMAFDAISGSFDGIYVWDPLKEIYAGKPSIDVVDANGNYIMWDWNHISKFQSEELAPAFDGFFKLVVQASPRRQ
jgi:peptidoglycan/LPS O-acetylase OafA/YrhL